MGILDEQERVPFRGSRTIVRVLAILPLTVALGGPARPSAAELSTEETCVARKLGAAGKFAVCSASATRRGAFNYYVNWFKQIAACEAKMTSSFDSVEEGAVANGGSCPSIGDAGALADFVLDCNSSVLSAARGNPLNVDPVTCASQLNSCFSQLSACSGGLEACVIGCPTGPHSVLKTGQMSCYDSLGAVIPCAGSGQDGELQNGASRSFTDNGDGTITDDQTGLTWEKLTDDGGIHDKDTSYNWQEAFSVKIAQLNSASFAGHSDWRLPNLHELETLRDLEGSGPVHQALNDSCTSGCSSCSCTHFKSWSSTSKTLRDYAWLVYFSGGSAGAAYWDIKPRGGGVRAVRGRR